MQPSSLSVQWAALSNVGRLRPRNEDVLRVLDERACAVLSDGMGGHRGGDVAARISVDCFCAEMERYFAEPQAEQPLGAALCAAVEAANRAVLEAAERERGLTGMGATLVAAVLRRGTVCFASVGDSRLYRFRAGHLLQLTRDHTMLQELVDGGMITAEQARQTPFRGMLTRALGVVPDVEVEVAQADLRAGDVLLLCSDGLTDMIDDDVIAAVLDNEDNLDVCAAVMVALANEAGGRDNISIVLARAGE